ncbi:MAG: ABC transporter ATP-binding protein [Candidatus Kaiserbacteria bacterium]|nr:ABC transporter ATP-binding protein [Candidatus Kaiserbacteria bacterium]
MCARKAGRKKVSKMVAVRVSNLVKSFVDGDREIQVLRGIDFSIAQGDFVAITGASGTGKSTLVYQMGLLDEPTSGSVFVGNKNAGKMTVLERTAYRLNHFGFVFQDYALIPELRAWENVALPVLMRGASRQKARKQASVVLDRFGMADRINHFPNQLSGGEGQRVSIARAIVHQPKVLFADEPTANLDSDRSRQIIDIFHELHRDGQTIVMVTHEMEYAKEAVQVVVMHDGSIA